MIHPTNKKKKKIISYLLLILRSHVGNKIHNNLFVLVKKITCIIQRKEYIISPRSEGKFMYGGDRVEVHNSHDGPSEERRFDSNQPGQNLVT